MSINKVILVGNCGTDPELRNTNDGREIASFSLATSESWKAKDGTKQEKTEWHKIVVFSSGLAGIVKNYVKKGSKLYIEGRLQTRKWTDKDGVDKWTTEIVLQGFNGVIQLLDSKKGEIDQHSVDKGNGYQPEAKPIDDEKDFMDDDIPF